MSRNFTLRRWKGTHRIEPIAPLSLDQALHASHQATREGYKSEIHYTPQESETDEETPAHAEEAAPAPDSPRAEAEKEAVASRARPARGGAQTVPGPKDIF